jgi:WXG100 family type VII secretion target
VYIKADTPQIQVAKDALDGASMQIVGILADVNTNGEQMKSHWSGQGQRDFDAQRFKWETGANEMDAAFKASNEALGEIADNFNRTETQVASSFQY